MDKEARGTIERSTQQIRKLLEHDFLSQLEGTFDVLRDGTVATKAGTHLSPRQVLQREKIVVALDHKIASGMVAREAVGAYARDAAFTALNRFVALKMLEARELVQECISKGEDSSGYREFCGMAPGIALLPGAAGYRLYLESIFDELSTEIKILFDRRDPASVLWPKRQTFADMLTLLNSADLSNVWGQDETIGWVYQYFNSSDERRRMREASQAPRNSRELAVRNQFFTPRYVVEFLSDNTLGRIWFEMQNGRTEIARVCDYLVRSPDGTYLSRRKKDPRDLKILDPACGSGHFLLYVFDLLLVIYEEAWADPDSPPSELTHRSLRDEYPDHTLLRRSIPELIIRHNLYGADIDPRCVQIAQLAVWMRAQRAFRDLSIRRNDRPLIRRSNIVVGEPIAVDERTVKEFESSLADRDVARIFSELFDTLKYAGELGFLLRLEYIIGIQPEKGKMRALFAPAQESIRAALAAFAEHAEKRMRTKHRLFVDDAAQGLGLLEICEKKYDAVLMNPPFGEPTQRTKNQVNSQYARSSGDLGAVFVERGRYLLDERGLLGAITNRTLLAIQGFADWRRAILDEGGLVVLVDLGHGVLDAMVETAMYVSAKKASESGHVYREAAFLGLLESANKGSDLAKSFRGTTTFRWRDTSAFLAVPGAPWAYWVPDSILSQFGTQRSFLQSGGQVCQGSATGDDFRFYRLRWEVDPRLVHVTPQSADPLFLEHRWSPVAKGGEYSLWWDDIYLLVESAQDRRQIREFVDRSGKLRSRPQNLDKYFLRGCTYPYRTTSAFGLRLLPPGMSFSVGGWAVFAPEGWTDEEVLAVFNNRVARYFMEVLLGQGDSSAAGTAARNYGAAAVGGIPWPNQPIAEVRSAVRDLINLTAHNVTDETTLFFSGAALFPIGDLPLRDIMSAWWSSKCDSWIKAAQLYRDVETSVVCAYALSPEDLAVINEGEGPSLFDFPDATIDATEIATIFRASVEELTDMAKTKCGAKRYVVKKAFYIDRCVDLASHILKANPESVIGAARLAGAVACGYGESFGRLLLSWLLGVAVCRFEPQDRTELPCPSNLHEMPSHALEDGSVVRPIWVDDPGHDFDIIHLVEKAADARWPRIGHSLLRDAADLICVSDLRDWYRREFFAYHVKAYSKSRRKAPIYWQLGIASGLYSVWLFYPGLTNDTLHKVVGDFVVAKVKHEERVLAEMVSAAGTNPSAAQRKGIAEQQAFVDEVRGFQDELKRVAPLWKPNLNDGVIINFAPLWRLMSHNGPWQRELKATWDALCDGEYDWSHLAMHLWPERVVAKCAVDRSLAVAHDLENVFWFEDNDGKWLARPTPTRNIDELVAERSSPAVKAALKSLLETPGPAYTVRARGRRQVAVA